MGWRRGRRRPVNLSDLVREAATRTPDKPALVFRGTELTWAALDRSVDSAAAGLLGLGLTPGDRVALLLGNVPAFAVAYFGALRAGLVALPVNTGYTTREVEHVITDAGARAAVCGRQSA